MLVETLLQLLLYNKNTDEVKRAIVGPEVLNCAYVRSSASKFDRQCELRYLLEANCGNVQRDTQASL